MNFLEKTVDVGGCEIQYRVAGDGEPADLCVVNTCTVTREGDAKSRTAVRRPGWRRRRPPCCSGY